MSLVASILGIIAAIIIAFDPKYIRQGWGVFIVSDLMWVYVGTMTGQWGLVVMNLVFTLICSWGIWRTYQK